MINLLDKKQNGKLLAIVRIFKVIVPSLLILGLERTNAQCDAPPLAMPAPFLSNDYTGDGDFSLLVFGNYNGTAGAIQGKLAVGGNFTFGHASTSFEVGTLLTAPFTTDNFIVNGEYTNYLTAPVHVKGNFKYRSSSGTPLPLHNPGEGTNTQFSGTLIDFTNLKNHYISQSSSYAAQATIPGSSAGFSGGTITLTGTGAVQDYVFNIDASGAAISGIDFVNIPGGSTITLNILGENITFSSGTHSSSFKEVLILNFPEATQIQMAGFNLNGSILAPLANLQILAQSKIDGKVVIGGNVAQQNAPFTFDDPCLNSSLPVSLTYFESYREGTQHLLRWSTAFESGFAEFEIHQSADGRAWRPIGSVRGKGSGNTGGSYTFPIASLSSGRYFRLKMIDLDASYEFSAIISVSGRNETAIISPNPSYGWIEIKSPPAQIKIVNNLGTPVSYSVSNDNIRRINTAGWNAGIYHVELLYPDGEKEIKKIIKN